MDERLPKTDEYLLKIVVAVMQDKREMSSSQIAKAASRWSRRKVDRRSVEALLTPLAGEVVIMAGLPGCRFIRQRRRGFLQLGTRWRLIEAPASPPDVAGAPVPAWPFPPTLSGSAAATLTFREDEPPTNAIGKSA